MGEKFAEFPSVHNTYTEQLWGIFDYSVYGPDSVLAGQERRRCLGSYATKEEALLEHPDAKVTDGSGFVDRPIPMQPYPGFSEDDIGESWLGHD